MRLAVVLLVLSGCAGISIDPVDDAAPPTTLPLQWQVSAEGCQTTAVFFLVEPERADPFLPVGFHARDLADFYYNTPVTAGKVPAFVAVSTCDRFDLENGQDRVEAALEIVYLGFYIDAPAFTSAFANRATDYNFYAVRYLGPDAPVDGRPVDAPFAVTAQYGWAHEAARASMEVVSMASQPSPVPVGNGTLAPDRLDGLVSQGSVQIDGDDAFAFDASAFFPQAFEQAPRLRFWQSAPDGVGFMEFQLPQRTVAAGPLASCHVPPGTIIHDVVGDRVGTTGEVPCGPTESFALLFGEHALQGAIHHLPGVHPV